ncbi:MAG: hypothetical protein Q7T77_09405 [Sulfuricurvum sp.]|nr:hypothetical protein [Sulfuricurvum sp.]
MSVDDFLFINGSKILSMILAGIPPPLKLLYYNIFLMNRHENTIKNAVNSLKYEEIKGK